MESKDSFRKRLSVQTNAKLGSRCNNEDFAYISWGVQIKTFIIVLSEVDKIVVLTSCVACV